MLSKIVIIVLGITWLTSYQEFSSCEASIHDKLRYHELIKSSDTVVITRKKRNADLSHTTTKDFHFEAFNMTLNCKLKPRTKLYAPTFKLTVYKAGKPRVVDFPTDQVYVGSCDGDLESEIRGTFKGDIFSGTLLYNKVRFGIEDAKPHIPSQTVADHMIVYKASDIKWNKDGENGSFCGNTDAEFPVNTDNIVVDQVVKSEDHDHGRYKRATTPSWDTCGILLVADYKFFQSVGGSDIWDTALHMSALMDRVDSIYRKTTWPVNGQSYSGLGFEIKHMRVHEDPTLGFNKDTGSWEAKELLSTFSKDKTFLDYCLVHLFTYQGFTGNTLGLAYIASSSTNDYGGLCSKEAGNFVQNTGWTTYKSFYGERVLEAQADLVTAHELGHNWGSQHDPGGSCSPSSIFGDGKYLMYAVSVSGADSNNDQFSSCSRTSIGAVLATKGSSCLTAGTSTDLVCGNGKIDDQWEECDGGFLGRFGLDSCCTKDCKLTSGSTCSPINYECCTNCKVASTGTMCRADNGFDCNKAAYCDGSSRDCPTSDKKTDGAECIDQGQCQGGVCQSFCKARGLIDCACSVLEESCQRCCKADSAATCEPFGQNNTLPNGRYCIAGYCYDKVCVASTSGTIAMLFDLINNLSVDFVVKFFKQNLVGCVLVFSMFLWVPGAFLLTYIDKRKRRGLIRSENIPVRQDRELTFDQDGRSVGQSDKGGNMYGMSSPRYKNLNFTDLGGMGSDA